MTTADGTTPIHRTAHPDAVSEIVVGQLGIEDRVAVLDEIGRLDATHCRVLLPANLDIQAKDLCKYTHLAAQ